jgi:hypothetical protein
MPPPRTGKHGRRASRPTDLLGTVLTWPPTTVSPRAGNRTGGGAGRVHLDDGRIVEARWSGVATMDICLRPGAEGQRVSLSRDKQGIYRATLVERVEVAGKKTAPPPRRALTPSIPPTLARAIAAALALGESPWTIAARHGISVELVR